MYPGPDDHVRSRWQDTHNVARTMFGFPRRDVRALSLTERLNVIKFLSPQQSQAQGVQDLYHRGDGLACSSVLVGLIWLLSAELPCPRGRATGRAVTALISPANDYPVR